MMTSCPTRPSLWQASSQRRKRDSGLTASGYSADGAELKFGLDASFFLVEFRRAVTEVFIRLCSVSHTAPLPFLALCYTRNLPLVHIHRICRQPLECNSPTLDWVFRNYTPVLPPLF